MSEDKFQTEPELTGIALAYRNKTYIADAIFPEVPVATETFKYRKYDKTAFLTAPDTLVGDKGNPNSIEIKSTIETAAVENHALKEEIPYSKIKSAANSASKIDLRKITAMQLTDCFKAAKELRTAKLLNDKTIYNGNFLTLGNNETLSESSVSGVDVIQECLDRMFYKANTMILSRKAASVLRRNPAIVAAVNKNNSTSGIVSIDALKELFELENIYVGETIIDTAKKGQVPAFGAAWKNNIILCHINPVATVDYGLTFGYNAVYEKPTIVTYSDPNPGTTGVETQKIYEASKNIIACGNCGYLIENVVKEN